MFWARQVPLVLSLFFTLGTVARKIISTQGPLTHLFFRLSRWVLNVMSQLPHTLVEQGKELWVIQLTWECTDKCIVVIASIVWLIQQMTWTHVFNINWSFVILESDSYPCIIALAFSKLITVGSWPLCCKLYHCIPSLCTGYSLCCWKCNLPTTVCLICFVSSLLFFQSEGYLSRG